MSRNGRHRTEHDVRINERTLSEYLTCAAIVREAEDIVQREGKGDVNGTARRLVREQHDDTVHDLIMRTLDEHPTMSVHDAVSYALAKT